MKMNCEKTTKSNIFYLTEKEHKNFNKDMQKLKKRGISKSRFLRDFYLSEDYKNFLKKY